MKIRLVRAWVQTLWGGSHDGLGCDSKCWADLTPNPIYKSKHGSVCLFVWQTGQGRGGYACISRPLSSTGATRIFGPIRWFCLSVVTNKVGEGKGRAGQGQERAGQTRKGKYSKKNLKEKKFPKMNKPTK